MKKIFFFTLFFLCSPRRALYIALLFVPCSNAQGNLQFNQVLSPSISTSSTFLANTVQQVTLTIPAGKIWKVESASYVVVSGSGSSFPGQITPYLQNGAAGQNLYFYVDDFLVTSWNSNSGLVDPSFPIWLNAGVHTMKISNNTGSNVNGAIFRGTLSAIEFNIIP